MPRTALILGAAGLLPTLAALALLVAGPPETRLVAFQVGAAYGATILSFLGGAWWGIAAGSARPDRLGGWLTVSVLPSLAGTAVVALLSGASVMALGLFFLVSPLVDRALAREGLAPPWWMALRLPLSLAMGVLHLGLGLLAPAAF